MQANNPIKETTKKIGSSVTFKLITICALALVLLIPASMVTSLIHERNSRKQGVIDEINAKWGRVQTIVGPVISIPYLKYIKDKDGTATNVTKYLHILMVGGILVILYTYLYILLQLEDYALLMGSIGLFVVLSITMYLTRKIDWYAIPQDVRKSNVVPPLDAPAQ